MSAVFERPNVNIYSSKEHMVFIHSIIENINDVPNKAKELGKFIFSIPFEDDDKIIIPVLLVLKMIELTTRQSDYISRELLIKAREGIDFKVYKQTELFPNGVSRFFGNKDLEYPVPNYPDETITISRTSHVSSKWAFITPRYMRLYLMGESKTNYGSYIRQMFDRILTMYRQTMSMQDFNHVVDLANEYVSRHFIPDPNKYNTDEPTMHNRVRDHFANIYNGHVEVKNKYGIADIESEDKVFEVKHVKDWVHGMGQVNAYSRATSKPGVLILFSEYSQDKPSQDIYDYCHDSDLELIFYRVN